MKDTLISPAVEFYDVVTRTHSEGGDALRSVLAEVDPSAGAILDVGAGTGRTVQIIAEAVPGARIVAVEPDLVMRTVLTHRVVADDDLRSRVTILADDAQGMAIPETLSAVVLYGVLGMLDRDERARLWDRLLPRLAPGAPVVVELLPIEKPQTLPPMPYAKERIGEHLYEATLRGEPGEDDLMVLNTTWRITGEEGEVRTVHGTSQWHTFGLDDLARETGLTAERLTLQAGLLRAGG
ncbi:class I SAM-dependent methyltransferase [Nonomuraea longispora]|uniref:Class I SAM-dependent methyltransferase n=2 Tax=Nonomuraea TaxID=83681 RepID=A0A4R4NHC2_9ACTN|nr:MULTISPECIES: class I SAM-dependent methyltransferase [Nonomuraea]TDC07914.1 class I SAM-dependent methyltransferase [Nonomuraea longispora]TDE56533.1 class I SAM-dependent methyltransferase [Nonomuraea mesophila]